MHVVLPSVRTDVRVRAREDMGEEDVANDDDDEERPASRMVASNAQVARVRVEATLQVQAAEAAVYSAAGAPEDARGTQPVLLATRQPMQQRVDLSVKYFPLGYGTLGLSAADELMDDAAAAAARKAEKREKKKHRKDKKRVDAE